MCVHMSMCRRECGCKCASVCRPVNEGHMLDAVCTLVSESAMSL